MTFPFSIVPKSDDEKFMLEALKEAWKAFQYDEVPIGAVLVKNGQIIAKGFNQVEMLKDATAHAEILCLKEGEREVSNWRLMGTTLYCTLEPCCMCAGAMFLTRIATLVWGAPDIRHGANGSWVDLFQLVHPMHKINVFQHVLKEPCAALLKIFFQIQRCKK